MSIQKCFARLLLLLIGVGQALGDNYTYTTIDYPAATVTYASGIDGNNIVGTYNSSITSFYGLPQRSWTPGKGSGGQLEVDRAQVAQR